MSRSNNTEIINPAKYFFEWQGSTGKLKYFDKNKGDKGENVFVSPPFTFLVLDRLSSIKGFSDADQSGFWSNEIRDIKKEPFTVRTKKGIVATGLYSTLAPILNQGAQYSQSVYIATKDDNGNFFIANFAFHGSAIGPWIDLCKGKDIYKYAITLSGSVSAKKGNNTFFVPTFKISTNITPETESKCIQMDKELQEYLKKYFSRNQSEQQEAAPELSERQKQDIAELKQDEYSDINSSLSEDAYNDGGEDEDPNDLPF